MYTNTDCNFSISYTYIQSFYSVYPTLKHNNVINDITSKIKKLPFPLSNGGIVKQIKIFNNLKLISKIVFVFFSCCDF